MYGVPGDATAADLQRNPLRAEAIVCDSCQRILYFDPAKELVDQKPGMHRPKRHHPKIDAPQAWYYRAEYGNAAKSLSA